MPAPQLTALNRGVLWHQNSGTHYLIQAEQFELSRLLKTVLEHYNCQVYHDILTRYFSTL